MKTPFLPPFFLLLTFLNIYCYGQNSFFKSYGKLQPDYAYGMCKTAEGGFFLTGTSNGYGGSNYLYALKTDQLGDTIWMKGYTTNNTIYGYSAALCSDSGYIVCGNTGYIRLDKNGNVLWEYTYIGVVFYSGIQTNDGGFILTGSIGQSSSSNGVDIYILKLNSTGVKQWAGKLGGAIDDYAMSVKQTPDGGYIFAGNTNSFGAGGNDLFLLKTNSTGDTLWSRTYGSSLAEGGSTSARQCVSLTSDKGYIVGSYTNGFTGGGGIDGYLLKTDSLGDLQWSKTYGGTGNELIYDVKEVSGGGYLFTGCTSSAGAGGNDIYLIRTDANGDTLFTKCFGAASNDCGLQVLEQPGKHFAVAGYGVGLGAGNDDAWLVQTDSLGNSTCHQYNTLTYVSNAATQTDPAAFGRIYITLSSNTPSPIAKSGGTVTDACTMIGIENFSPLLAASLSPNPATNETRLQLGADHYNVILVIQNNLGQIMDTVYSGFIANGQTMLINTERYPKGLYLINIKAKEGSRCLKLLVE